LAFSPSVKGFGWELDMKKKDIGIISADDGAVFVVTGKSFQDYGDHSVTTTTYEHHMEHGMWMLQNGDLLVIASEGPARIAPDGNILWKTPWKWNRAWITFSPKRVQNDKYLIYRYSGLLICYDLEKGTVKWEVPGNGEVMFDSKEQKMIIHDGKDVSAYEL
jgi:outer membrane protein assembly factor BamB